MGRLFYVSSEHALDAIEADLVEIDERGTLILSMWDGDCSFDSIAFYRNWHYCIEKKFLKVDEF